MPRLGTVRYSLFIIAAALLVSNTSAQMKPTTPIEMRLNDVCAILSQNKPELDTVLTAAFMQQIPPDKLNAGLQALLLNYGYCTSIAITKRVNDFSVVAEAESDKGYIYPLTFSIESNAPFRIEGLFVRPPRKKVISFDGVIEQLKALDGETGMWVYDVEEREAIAGYNEHVRLPTGSTFKLYVLGAVNYLVERGKMKWSDVVTLDSNYYSLPSGIIHTWPHGAPVTIQTLATQMISISDNTATDILIHHVGRDRVETMVGHMGHKDPKVNRPFLTTRELFALKFSRGGRFAEQYAKMSTPDGRRAILDSIKDVTLDEIEFTTEPMLPDKVEWFATPSELCLAMAYFGWEMSESDTEVVGVIKPAMDVMSVNSGLDLNKKAFPYIGYKGGSETGVLNMTYLLQRKDGRWFAISVSWMNTEEAVDLTKFSGIVSGAIKLLEQY